MTTLNEASPTSPVGTDPAPAVSPDSRRRSIIFNAIAFALLSLGILLTVCVGSIYYYLFGQVGTPVESFDLAASAKVEGEDWQVCEHWFERLDVRLRRTSSLQARLRKQERIDGRLEPENEVEIKVRRNPLSIYLRWNEPFQGREVIYRVHKRGNRLIAHEGGTLRQFSPDVMMPLDHELTRQFSLHPINELSTQYIRRELPRYLADARANPQLKIAFEPDQKLDERSCFHIRFTHPEGRQAPQDYCRFDLYIDQETDFPVRWEKYRRKAGTSPPTEELIEYFEIIDPIINAELGEKVFDPANEAYDFNPEWVMTWD